MLHEWVKVDGVKKMNGSSIVAFKLDKRKKDTSN